MVETGEVEVSTKLNISVLVFGGGARRVERKTQVNLEERAVLFAPIVLSPAGLHILLSRLDEECWRCWLLPLLLSVFVCSSTVIVDAVPGGARACMPYRSVAVTSSQNAQTTVGAKAFSSHFPSKAPLL